MVMVQLRKLTLLQWQQDLSKELERSSSSFVAFFLSSQAGRRAGPGLQAFLRLRPYRASSGAAAAATAACRTSLCNYVCMAGTLCVCAMHTNTKTASCCHAQPKLVCPSCLFFYMKMGLLLLEGNFCKIFFLKKR